MSQSHRKKTIRTPLASRISAAFLLSLLRFLSGIKFLSRRQIQKHYRQNGTSLSFSPCTDSDSFIENQLALSGLRYGPRMKHIPGSGTMAYAGCEIISLYNAAAHLNRPFSLPELIRDFEKKGSVFSGLLGGSPLALNAYLEKHGFTCSVFLPSRKNPTLPDSFDGENNTVSYILCKLNNENRFRDQIHTVCITYTDKQYRIHNDSWCHSENAGSLPAASPPYDSLQKAVDAALSNGSLQGRLLMLTKIESR